jgi:tRNA(fMet)-specific endonuclease VapC
VALGELIHGVEKSKHQRANPDVVEGFAGRVEVIAYDTAAAYQFGQLKQELNNQQIGPYDLMIAAHARSLGLTLITNNTTEFKRVAGLRMENWVLTETQ